MSGRCNEKSGGGSSGVPSVSVPRALHVGLNYSIEGLHSRNC